MLNKSEIPSFSYLLQPHRCGCTCTCDTCGTCTRIHCVVVCTFIFSFWQTFGVHIGPGIWGFFSKKILVFVFFIAYSYYLLFFFFGYGRYTFSQKTMRRRPGLNFVRNRAFLVSLCHATLSSDCTSVCCFFIYLLICFCEFVSGMHV
jgi:hypothetical protein